MFLECGRPVGWLLIFTQKQGQNSWNARKNEKEWKLYWKMQSLSTSKGVIRLPSRRLLDLLSPYRSRTFVIYDYEACIKCVELSMNFSNAKKERKEEPPKTYYNAQICFRWWEHKSIQVTYCSVKAGYYQGYLLSSYIMFTFSEWMLLIAEIEDRKAVGTVICPIMWTFLVRTKPHFTICVDLWNEFRDMTAMR